MTTVFNNCISATSRELTDADLVRSAREGETWAFDCLVLRHRANVLYAARSCVTDWEQAEDVAQQALMEAYKSLQGLRDGTSFRAWLMTITRRCASRYREREASQPDAIELSEAVICSISCPQAFPGIDDVAERVRASLSELSARSRQVVTLHYLDGYSCKEIGGRLGVPTGTVKRILHESRNSLRNKMGITKGDIGRMVVLDRSKKGPRRLDWWISGNWPGNMMGSLIAQSIALTTNKKPMNAAEIGRAIDANIGFVEEALEPLVREELVTKSGRKYSANFIALDAEDWIEVSRETRSHAAEMADKIEGHLPALQHAWETTSFPARGFPWTESIWTVLSILVGHYGVSRHGVQSIPGPVHAGSGQPYWAAGREQVSPEHVMWSNGLSISDSPIPGHFFWYGHMWSYGFNRDRLGTYEERSSVLAAIAWDATDIESISSMSKLSIDRAREIVAEAIELGVVARHGDDLRLTFPVFGPDDDETLCPTVDSVSSQVTQEILDPATASVAELLRTLGYGHLAEQCSPWRRWMKGDIVGESLRELLKRGVLPDPGERAPFNFAMVGWKAWTRLFANSA
jgi:RNA polymerase sigma-70 factor (ECF subfamily)